MAASDIGKTKKCEKCGKKFIVKAPTQIYCSPECRIKVQRELDRLYKGRAGKPIVKRSPKGTRKVKKRKSHRLLFGLYSRH